MDEVSTLIEEVRQLRAEVAELRQLGADTHRMMLRSIDSAVPFRFMGFHGEQPAMPSQEVDRG